MFRVHISICYCYTENEGTERGSEFLPLGTTIVTNKDGRTIWGGNGQKEEKKQKERGRRERKREKRRKDWEPESNNHVQKDSIYYIYTVSCMF